jgi:predicted nucleic acid-binding Zn ribbon protein
MNKGSEELEPSGTGNLALRRFHGEKDRRKCDSKKKFEKHSACIMCSEKDRRKYNSKNFFENHRACIVCGEKMAMECRQVSTGENEGER